MLVLVLVLVLMLVVGSGNVVDREDKSSASLEDICCRELSVVELLV